MGKTVVVNCKLVARREILSHAQSGRRTSPGESRVEPGKLDRKTMEVIALAVSATNNCDY